MNKGSQEIPDKRKNIDYHRPSLDIHQVAELIGCCTKTVVKLCEDGELIFHRVGNRRKFRPEAWENFWNKNSSASKLQKAPRAVDITSTPSVRSSKQRKGGDRKGSDKEPLGTEVSKAHRLKELSEEMRKW